jgi:hypothetical protein
MTAARGLALGLVLSALLCGCRSSHRDNFALDEGIEPRLPPLWVVMDQESLVLALGDTERLHDGQRIRGIPTTVAHPSRAVLDAAILIEREVADRFLTEGPVGSRRGVMRIRATHRRKHYVGMGYAFVVVSVATLTAINLLGFPICSQSGTLRLEATITDLTGEVLGRYEGRGDVTEFAAYYWGYSGSGAARAMPGFPLGRATLNSAVVAALEEIRAKIQPQARMLAEKLR